MYRFPAPGALHNVRVTGVGFVIFFKRTSSIRVFVSHLILILIECLLTVPSVKFFFSVTALRILFRVAEGAVGTRHNCRNNEGAVTITPKILRSLFCLLHHKFDEVCYDGLLVIFFACIAIG